MNRSISITAVRILRRLLLLGCLVVIVFRLEGQVTTRACDSIYQRALQYIERDRPDYNIALNKLAAYKVCNPDGADKANRLIKKLFHKIDSQRLAAVKQRKIAEKRLGTIRAQRNSLDRQYFELLLSYVRTELAQIDQLPRVPTNLERRERLERLLARLAPITTAPIVDSIKMLIGAIPPPANRLFMLPADSQRLIFYPNPAGDSFFVVYKDAVEIWSGRILRRQNKYRLADLPGRSRGGKICWMDFDRNKGALYFEIAYRAFAMARMDSMVENEDETSDLKPKFLDREVVRSEKEVFSIRFRDTRLMLEGISQFPVTEIPAWEILTNENFMYRHDPFVKRDSLVEKFVDQSEAMEWRLPEPVRSVFGHFSSKDMDPRRGPLVRLISKGSDSTSGIYEVYDRIDYYGLPNSSEIGRLPIMRLPGDRLSVLYPLFSQMSAKSANTLSFEPAAIDIAKKRVLLGGRLYSFQMDSLPVIDSLNISWSEVSTVRFADGTDALIIEYKNGNLSTYNLITHTENIFLATNSYRHAELSADGKNIFFMRPDGSLEIWKMSCFGKDGWNVGENK